MGPSSVHTSEWDAQKIVNVLALARLDLHGQVLCL